MYAKKMTPLFCLLAVLLSAHSSAADYAPVSQVASSLAANLDMCTMCTDGLYSAALKLSDLEEIIVTEASKACDYVCFSDTCNADCVQLMKGTLDTFIVQLANNETRHTMCSWMKLCKGEDGVQSQSQQQLMTTLMHYADFLHYCPLTDLCSLCTCSIHSAAVKLNESEAVLVSAGNNVCNLLCQTDTCRQSCHEFVRQLFDAAVQQLGDEQFEKQLCQRVYLCPKDAAQSAADTVNMLLKVAPKKLFDAVVVAAPPAEADDESTAETCNMCNTMVNIAFAGHQAHLSDDRVKAILMDACQKLGSQLAPTCRTLVDANFDKVMGWIKDGTYPVTEICKVLKYC